MEVALDGGEIGRAGRDGDAHRVLLAGVAHVGRPLEGDDARRDPLLDDGGSSLALERAEEGVEVDSSGTRAAEPRDARLHDVKARRGHAHPPRREHAGVRRHDDGAHLQLGAERRGVHRATTATDHEHEVTRVVAAAHRHELERVDHVGVDETDDPVGERRGRQAKRGAELGEGALRGLA